MKTWWHSLSDNAQWALMVTPILIVIFAFYAWIVTSSEPLRQYEVTLGDGTRATCIVVRGVRSAGVTCVPHVVLGPDTEDAP
jgi:hypothetical protein